MHSVRRRSAVGRGLMMSSALALTAWPALAQETITLETVVVEGGILGGSATGAFSGYVPAASRSAGKSDIPLIETPQAISVVGAEQIADQAARTVTEATRYSPGIRSETFGADPRNDWFLIRGFTSQANSTFLDGLQLQSSASFATWRVNPYLLERIDILRGPSSALYGGSDAGGLINLQSKRPLMANTGEISTSVNEFGNVWGGIDVNGVNAEGTIGYRVVATGNFGDTKVDFNEDDQYAFLPSVTWAPDAYTSFSLYAHLSKQKANGVNFLPYEGTVVDAPFGRISRSLFTSEPSIDGLDREQALIGYELEHSFNEAVTVRQNLRYGELSVDLRGLFGSGYLDPAGGFAGDPATGILTRSDFVTTPRVDLFNVDNQLEWAVATGPLAHTFLFGLDYKRFDLDDNSGFTSSTNFDLLNPSYLGVPGLSPGFFSTAKQDQLGVYAQDNIRFGNLGVLLSGRYDDVSTDTADLTFGSRTSSSENEVSGRAGIIYNFDNGLAPYVSASRSFLPLVGVEGLSGDPLTPETATQYEVGLKYQPESWGGSLVGVSLFDLTRENFTTSDGFLFNRQIGEVSSKGVEFEAIGQITDALKVTAAYTFYDIEVEDGAPIEIGRRPAAVPEQFGSLWLDYSVLSGRFEGLSFGGGARYVGSSFADTANTLKVPDVWLADAAIRYEKGNYAAALNVSNLFDEEFVGSCSSPTACFYGDAREVTATLSFKW